MSDLQCIPEWCAQEAEHDATCPEHAMPMTKGEFVAAAEGGAKAAIKTFLYLRNEERILYDEAMQTAVQEAGESAICFAGIGSCGRGWCKHG